MKRRHWLYQKLLLILGSLGLWTHPHYLAHKRMVNRYGTAEVMPLCVIYVSGGGRNIELWLALNDIL